MHYLPVDWFFYPKFVCDINSWYPQFCLPTCTLSSWTCFSIGPLLPGCHYATDVSGLANEGDDLQMEQHNSDGTLAHSFTHLKTWTEHLTRCTERSGTWRSSDPPIISLSNERNLSRQNKISKYAPKTKSIWMSWKHLSRVCRSALPTVWPNTGIFFLQKLPKK